jgi:hypothetical protein
MAAIRDALYRLAEAAQPSTVRHIFYLAVSEGVIEKKESEYKQTVVRLIGEMREAGELPWEWIVDESRLYQKARSFDGWQDALENTALTYRRSLWQDQGVNVEVWCEKRALAGLLYDVTNPWDVRLMLAGGFNSKTWIHMAAEEFEMMEKTAIVYLLTDHDPAGFQMEHDLRTRMHRYAPHADITVERIALSLQQIEEWDLPTRPAKKNDPFAKGFEGPCVELDAVPPHLLQDLVREAIEQHIDPHALAQIRLTEKIEKRTLLDIVEQWVGA